MSDERPFHSVSHALRMGYAAEARHLYQPDSTFAQLRGGSVRLPTPPYFEGFTAHDRAAEAGKVVGLCRRVLNGPELFAVEAYYLPNDKAEPGVLFRKQFAASQLVPMARDAAACPGAYAAAVVAEWAGLGAVDSDKTAKACKVSQRTVQRWNKAGGRSAHKVLNALLDEARKRLGTPMREYGLIPE